MNETVAISMMEVSAKMNAKTKRNMKIVATIEARMTSTRLFGKVLKPVMRCPVLELLIEEMQISEIQCFKTLILLDTEVQVRDCLSWLDDIDGEQGIIALTPLAMHELDKKRILIA
ncbi:MAG: hypothetical protein IBX40_12480 [Methanosarcinales archaeon]|nr:hypothetical protein [Methanosarcinales archaeon]